MSGFRIGQDVIVESNTLYDGEAFLTSIAEETENIQGGGVYVDLSSRDDFDAEIAMVSKESVMSLTDMFDAVREFKELRRGYTAEPMSRNS